MKQQELADQLGLTRRTVVKMESDDPVSTIPHPVLIRLSEIFDVSVDYLLGLTDVPCRDNATAENLGLSETAIRVLMSDEVNKQFLNKLLCSSKFIELANMADLYFEDVEREGYDKSNAIFSGALSQIDEYKEVIGYKDKGYDKDVLKVKSAIQDYDEIKMSKLLNLFEHVLIEIKSTYDIEPYMTSETELKTIEIAEHTVRHFAGKSVQPEQFVNYYVMKLKEEKVLGDNMEAYRSYKECLLEEMNEK